MPQNNIMIAQGDPTGVHLVGSVPLPTSTNVFLQAAKALPDRLLRIPDGETSHRQTFTLFQRENFSSIPQVLRQYDAEFNSVPVSVPTASELASVSSTLVNIPLQTHYEKYAVESYGTLKSLQDTGKISSEIRLQVSLPSSPNVICLIADGYQVTVEPFYEEAILRSLKGIEAQIPHTNLSIQWDIAAEFAMLEGVTWPHFAPWFSPVKEGIIDRLVQLANAVSVDVECGFHLCYGDIGHRHFIEPKNMGLLVEIANAIMNFSKRQISWIHMLVPKDRIDDVYYAPLKELNLGNTQLYLGLIHYDDLEGTKKRIEAASRTGKKFGIATECGMGRTPANQIESIFNISAECSAPYDFTA